MGVHGCNVFGLFGYGLFMILMVLVFVVLVILIVCERNYGMLVLLLNLLMGCLLIFFGKFIGSFVCVLLLLVMSLFVVVACYVMIGVDLV